MRKRALITGSSGFVGRHFAHHLWNDWSLYPVDIASEHPRDCRKGFKKDMWADADLVIHAAATIPPIDQRTDNDLAVANDLSIDADMFQWAARNRPGKIVYFSSSAAYPVNLQQSEHYLSETDLDLGALVMPDAMYGMTKLVGELQVRELRKLGVDVLVVRPFTGYGTDQSLDYPFPAFIKRALERRSVFDIWGSGTQVRDFIHIDDIVNGVMAMVDAGFDGTVNLGTGVPTTLYDFAKMVIAEAPGYSPAIRLNKAKPDGAIFRCCHPSLLHTLYEPKVTLQEGIKRALKI